MQIACSYSLGCTRYKNIKLSDCLVPLRKCNSNDLMTCISEVLQKMCKEFGIWTIMICGNALHRMVSRLLPLPQRIPAKGEKFIIGYLFYSHLYYFV